MGEGKEKPRFEAGLRRVSQHGVFRSAPPGQPAKAATVPALRSGSNPTVRLTLIPESLVGSARSSQSLKKPARIMNSRASELK